MMQNERFLLQYELRRIFRPGAPVDSQSLFSGRTRQVDLVMRATFQVGQHVAMFGERRCRENIFGKDLGGHSHQRRCDAAEFGNN